MLADTKPGKFLIVFSVASTSISTNLCWSSGSTVKTFMSVTTSLSFEIVVIRFPFSLVFQSSRNHKWFRVFVKDTHESRPTFELTRRRESKHPPPHQDSCEGRS